MTFRARLLVGFALVLGVCLGSLAPVTAQGTLSQQVLQLLQRVNTFTNTNTFNDLRVANTAIPSITTYRIYADTSGNLYFNGGLIAGAGGGVTPHNLLSTTHADTLAGSPVRGSVLVANSTPKWAAVTIGASGFVVQSNGTDTVFGNDGSALINLNGANLTGTLAAVSGVNLTNLNATNLASGTVNLARLSNIANAQIAAAAGIVYSKLTLTGSVVSADLVAGTLVNANINAAAAIAYSKLALTGSVLFADWSANGCTAGQLPQYTGAAWACHTMTTTDIAGVGTVTSVALSTPSFLTTTGSPITGGGTLAVTLTSQTQNLIFASPNGGSGAPTFRAFVNADLPTSGVTAGTYPLVTVNAQGIVTTGSSSFASGTIVASTPWTFTQTWNNGAVTFTGILENIVSSGSAAASLLMDLQISGATKFNVDKAGNVVGLGTEKVTGGYSAFATTPSASIALTAGLTAATQLLTSTQASGDVSGVNLIDLAATWNNAANTPTAIKLNILDTASNAASLLMDLQKGGVSQWKVSKSGAETVVGLASLNGGWTIPTAVTAVVTDTDALTIGGNKIPNTSTVTCTQLNVNSVSGDCMFIADRAYQVTAIKFVQATAGGAGCVGDIEKLTGTQAPGGGTVMGTGSYDCNATANNTVTTYTLTGTTATLQLAAGNRMGIKLAGTLTALKGLTATVSLKGI